MMYLTTNDVVVFRDGGPEWVLLFVDGDMGFAIDRTDPKSWPVSVDLWELLAAIEDSRAQLVEGSIPRTRTKVTERQEAAMARRWDLIEPIIASGIEVFDPKKRFAHISKAAERAGCTLNTVRAALQDYWKKGCTKAALLTDYDRCGAPGVPRLDPGERKRGRPRTVMAGVGVNVNRATRRAMSLAVRRFLAMNRKLCVAEAYRRMIATQYCVVTPGEQPGQESAAWAAGVDPFEIPTEEQFRYHIRQFADELGLRQKRMGAKKYAREKRGLPSTARSETWGPGSRYLIDATILDVYLRSRLDRTRIVGRPVLYVVVDVFSGMIVGIYVGIENPCWMGAAMALANATQSKVEFCRQYGIEITEEDWPSSALPARLEADKGEVDSVVAEQLQRWFQLTVETASAWRPDLKGMVEGTFKTLPAVFAPYVPGYIEPDFAMRGARDYRLDGVLDVGELTAIIINIVLHRNNDVELRRYDRPAEMPVSQVPAIPRDLWNWGIANRSGALVRRPDWYVRFHLLPTATATITERGLEFQGCRFVSEGMIQRQWLERARHSGSWEVTVSFDPRLADAVLLHSEHGEHGYEICALADASRAHAGTSFREIAAEKRAEKQSLAASTAKSIVGHAQTVARIESIVASAQAKSPFDRRSNAAKVKGIADTRSAERAHDCRQEALDAGPLAVNQELLPAPPAAPALPKVVREPRVSRFLKDEHHG